MYSMLNPQELDTQYSHSNTHIMSKGRVVIKSLEKNLYSFEYYPSFLSQVMCASMATHVW